MHFLATTLGLLVLFAVTQPASAVPPGPRELGRVHWGRDLMQALADSKRHGRPVLALFQEIPGCATCVGFGEGPLSHPLLVEVIEREFVPLAVHNNATSGPDCVARERFREPAWNNPVMRFLDSNGRDVLPRRDALYGPDQVAARLVAALAASRRPVPDYLRLVAEELSGERASAVYTMHCFWQGESALARIPGVRGTRAVFAGGHEGVEVRFDPAVIARAALDRQAARLGYARHGGGPVRDAPASDQLHHLRGSRLALLPLTARQAGWVNASLAAGEDPLRWLSPSQRQMAGALAVRTARDAHAFDGLERPSRWDALGAYQDELLVRLSGLR